MAHLGIKYILLLGVIFTLASGWGAKAEEASLRRTRHKAAVIALLCHNPTPQLKKEFACQCSCLAALCRMFVQEGGYYVARVPEILSIRDPETAHIGLLLRELDGTLPANSLPRTLQMACAVGLVYAIPSSNGIYAAVHAARQVEADINNDAIARAAYSLLVSIIEGANDDKEQLLKIAAANADDENVARELRALRLRDWRKLPEEKTGLGRLCRALHIWLRAKNWAEAERLGGANLRYHESRRFLAIISAAWFDLHGLPEDLVWESLNSRDIRELCADLYNLAAGGVLIAVDEKLVKNIPQARESFVSEKKPESPEKTENSANIVSSPRFPASPVNPGVWREPVPPAAPLAPRTPAFSASTRVETHFADKSAPTVPAAEIPAVAPSPVTAPVPALPTLEIVQPADYYTVSYPVQ